MCESVSILRPSFCVTWIFPMHLMLASNGGPIYRFLGVPAMRTRWMAGAVAHKSGRCRDQSRSDNSKQESLDL